METMEIPLTSITVSDLNTRKDLKAGTEDTSLEDLTDSIREHGLLNPVIAMNGPGSTYELIAGQRRFLACKELGWNTITAVIRNDLDSTDALTISLVENVHRADMSPVDKARAYQALYSRYQDYGRVAQQTGVSVPTVRRYLSLLNLAPSIQKRVSTADGPVGVGTLSNVAKNFHQDDQEFVLDRLGGFNQRTQTAIIKGSGGDPDKIESLRTAALEGAFEVRSCSEGLCFDMPQSLKQRVKKLLRDDQPDTDTGDLFG